MIDLEKMAKEHERLFPNASLESQVWKLEEEIEEFYNAKTEEERIKEKADIYIVCGGLCRWLPKTAHNIRFYYEIIDLPLHIEEKVENEVNRKWQINLKRKWEWNGKTYKHVGKDGNE